jgi:hypothetical protein
MPTSRLIAAIACALALIGASCSDSADTEPTGSAGSTTEPSATEPTATAAGVSTTTTTEAESEEPEFIELAYFEGTERATFSSVSSGDADDESTPPTRSAS